MCEWGPWDIWPDTCIHIWTSQGHRWTPLSTTGLTSRQFWTFLDTTGHHYILLDTAGYPKTPLEISPMETIRHLETLLNIPVSFSEYAGHLWIPQDTFRVLWILLDTIRHLETLLNTPVSFYSEYTGWYMLSSSGAALYSATLSPSSWSRLWKWNRSAIISGLGS